MIKLDPRLTELLDAQPYPFVFVTVSGAHLYGFPSPDSDWDLRGAHVLPARQMLGLRTGNETIEYAADQQGLDADLVTHDVLKFMKMLMRPNGYVLEQLTSPLVVQTSPEHEDMLKLVPAMLTRYHAHHYLGFGATQWRLFEKENPRRVKPLLYVYRVLLTGIHLMRTGQVEANLMHLNEIYKLRQVPELVERKLFGAEKQTLEDADFEFHQKEYLRLVLELETARDETWLPELPSGETELNEILLHLRFAG